MSATTVPAVRAALVTRVAALVAASGNTETITLYGGPSQGVPESYIAVADTASGVKRDQRTLPLRKTSSRTETYDLRLVIWCFTGDHDAQRAVTEKAWGLATLIDDGLRDEYTLGGLVTSALPSSFDDSDFLLNEGRAAQIVVLISVTVTRA